MLNKLLKRTSGRASLTREELYTDLCDCEAVIISRPLTYASIESNDLVPLAPVMFLRDLTIDGVPDYGAIDSTKLTKRHEYLPTVT